MSQAIYDKNILLFKEIIFAVHREYCAIGKNSIVELIILFYQQRQNNTLIKALHPHHALKKIIGLFTLIHGYDYFRNSIIQEETTISIIVGIALK